jgi:Dolichyl-phosphate-mannose-protein mannosyltransferase
MTIDRVLRRDATVYAACGVALALGLFFIFVWAPHPWGWDGFDHYHQLALDVAAGRPFPTMEVPWGYAYFLAGFYRLLGDRPWIPLVVQAALNATLPLLVYRLALTWVERRTAVLAAVLTGVFSFNTVYASTQSSDAVCTVIFMVTLVAFVRARTSDRWPHYALAGLLAGLAPQFRPNLILVPILLAVFIVFDHRFTVRLKADPTDRRRLVNAAVLLAGAAAALTPWVVRNYRLTGTVLPTSVHGGVQLWYGTLQVGPYLRSRAYNPRAVFDTPVFDYTSLDRVPIVISTHAMSCADAPPSNVALVYWSDRNPVRHRVPPASFDQGRFRFEIPAPGQSAVIYYYFDATWPSSDDAPFEQATPFGGEASPFIYFVSQDHLGDLDVHGDLLDIFDLVRLARYVAWREPVPFEGRLATAGIMPRDAERAAKVLARAASPDEAAVLAPVIASIDHDERHLRMVFRDGSSIDVPRRWNGTITDLAFDGALAVELMPSRVPLASVARPSAHRQRCAALEDVDVNRVFYRAEPHLMRRYSALAFDNIRRDPWGFARASAYRAVRVFVIEGSEDRHTAQQFSRSRIVYAAATVVSVAYLLLFVAGVVIAWRRRLTVLLPLALIVYVPLTISVVLTNMRYSMTVQPLIFMFIAVALTAALERASWLPARSVEGRDPAGT